MIAIDTSRLTLATIATRLTPACPGAPRNCSKRKSRRRDAWYRCRREQDGRDSRDQHQRPDQQKCNRRVTEQRQSGDGRQQRGGRADGKRDERGPERAQTRERALLIAGLQRTGWRGPRGFQCRRETAEHRNRNAKAEEEDKRGRVGR